MKRVGRAVILGVFAAMLMTSSTFGWRPTVRREITRGTRDASLVARLKEHVLQLSSRIGDRNLFEYDRLRQAASYIEQRFADFGYTLESQPYLINEQPVRNLSVTHLGRLAPEDVVIVGAHYDSCFNPGADDNASGVAVLLELARVSRDASFDRTVKFVAFTSEEPPIFQTELMGSRVFARAARARQEQITAMLALEMVGYYSEAPRSQRYPPLFGLFYPSRANFIGVVSNFHSRSLCRQVVRAFRGSSSLPIEGVSTFSFIPGVNWSDHWSFWQEGYRAVMVTDTAFLRNPHYHQATDTWETLNYTKMASVMEGLQGVLRELASTVNRERSGAAH